MSHSKVKCSSIPTLKKALAMAWFNLDEGGVQRWDRQTRPPVTSPLRERHLVNVALSKKCDAYGLNGSEEHVCQKQKVYHF